MVGDMDRPSRPCSDEAVPGDPGSADAYLRRVAVAELHDVRGILTQTGLELEASRMQCRARSQELEVARRDLSNALSELEDTRSQLRDSQQAMSRSAQEFSAFRSQAQRQAQESAAVLEAQRNHIARLKTQIQAPWRLLAKWWLRRGPYAGNSTTRNH